VTLSIFNLLDKTSVDREIDFDSRIKALISRYLNRDILNDRLSELPQQFHKIQPRRWERIDWQSINNTQIIDIETKLFLAIIKGSIDTEAPIRDYTHTSRQYLDRVHPQMAAYVGGKIDADGNRQCLGLWELEERRHTPALMAIYRQLSGEEIQPAPKPARPYQPHRSPRADLYRHGLHRISTEYGATCLYLWLMAHSTGTLQQVLGELVCDEVNHLIKFWGFGVWLYPYPKGWRFLYGCQQLWPRSTGNNFGKTYRQMMSVMHWHEWEFSHKCEIVIILYLVLQRLLAWHDRLDRSELEQLFGEHDRSS
jgi:hypothetical protein